MQKIRDAKIKDLDRLCKELNCEEIKKQISDKINACVDSKEANNFGTVDEILQIKNTLENCKQLNLGFMKCILF